MGSAHWDLEDHNARQGGAPILGALGAIPAGRSVVEGGTIPYQDWALAQRAENRANWVKLDPAVKCYMPGIPRGTYMPFPFQFVQSKDAILVAYEFTSSSRVIHLNRPGSEAELESWMGYSLGSFDGDTLVVDVTAQVPDTWFDSSGNFHQRRASRGRALHAHRRQHDALRGDHRGSPRYSPGPGQSACRFTGVSNPVPGSWSSNASSSRNTPPTVTNYTDEEPTEE